MAPRANNKFGAPLVELTPLWSKLTSFEGKFTVSKTVLVTLLGLFGTSISNLAPLQWFSVPIVNWRPGNCTPLLPLIMPLAQTYATYRKRQLCSTNTTWKMLCKITLKITIMPLTTVPKGDIIIIQGLHVKGGAP